MNLAQETGMKLLLLRAPALFAGRRTARRLFYNVSYITIDHSANRELYI